MWSDRLWRGSGLTGLILALPCGANSQEAPSDVRALTGCYEVTAGTAFEAPSVFLLSDVRGVDVFEANRYLVRPKFGTGRWQGPWAAWHLDPQTRAITVVWTTGYDGVRMDLEDTERGLIGTAVDFDDFVEIDGELDPTSAIELKRVECPPSLRVNVRNQREGDYR